MNITISNPVRFLLCSLFLVLGAIQSMYAQNNNMGIGTSDPDASAILDITSNSRGLLIPRLSDTQQGALSGPAGLLIYNSTQNRFNYYNGGWKPVGLWSLNGSAARYTAGNVETTGGFYINNDNPTIHLQDTDGNSGFIHQNANLMYFLTGGVNANTWAANGGYWPLTLNMTTDAATFGGPAYFMEGNVGIGTTNPLSKLSISPSTVEPKITLWDGGDGANHYGFGVSGGQLNYHVDVSGSSHVFWAGGKNGNGTELMRIKGDGNVGIGTNNPGSYKLSLKHGNFGLQLQHASGGSDYWELFHDNISNALFLYNGYSSSTPIGQFNYTTGVYTSSSDRRLKENINPLNAVLPSLLKLEVKKYTFISDPKKELNIGLIAQEVEKLFPELVAPPVTTERGETNYSMNYAGFGIIAVKAIQEQQVIIENQAAKIEAQQAEIDAIKKALEKAGIKLD